MRPATSTGAPPSSARRTFVSPATTTGGSPDGHELQDHELQDIVDYRRADPAIHPVFSALSHDDWTSTSNAFETELDAWIVVFFNGGFLVDLKGHPHYLRAVRGGS